jgi:hypothetical protein
MKNWLILIFIMSALSMEAQQINLQLKGYFGGHTGIFNEKLETLKKETIYGYQGGFSLRVSRGRAFIEPSFGFLRTHVALSDTIIKQFNDLGLENPQVRFNSFEFPFVIGYKFVQTPMFKWYVAGGLAMSVSIKSQLRDGKEEVVRLKGRDLGLRNPRWGLRMGTGVDIAFFNIEFYYGLGLNSSSRTVYRTQTHFFELNFGVLF